MNCLVVSLLSFFVLAIARVRLVDAKKTLSDVLHQSAGLYVSPELNPFRNDMYHNISNTVLVTAFNFGYVNFIRNLKCYLDRLNMKALVIAMDEMADAYADEHLTNFHSYFLTGKQTVEATPTEFRTKQFHVITNRKIEGVLNILKLGYDVIFIDPDIALLRDPTPYLFWKGVDYVHSVNKICPGSDSWDFYATEEEGNTGFYFIRSNKRTISLLETFRKEYPRHPQLDDQTILWTLLRGMKPPLINPRPVCTHFESKDQPDTLVTCHLDGCLFSAGGLRGAAYNWLEAAVKKRNETVVSIHANFVKGKSEYTY